MIVAQDGLCYHIHHTTSSLSLTDRWGHVLARMGINCTGHRVKPGLYALGNLTADSPVFRTANYTLSFDALRSLLTVLTGKKQATCSCGG